MIKHTVASSNVQSFVSTDRTYDKIRRTSNRKVQFADNAIVHVIPSRSEMPSRQRNQVWISKEEHNEMKIRLNQLVRTMNQIEAQYPINVEQQDQPSMFHHSLSHNSIMYRGLEGKTSRSSTDKKLLVLDALCAVFLEQEQQRQKGIQCPEAISAVYSAVSASATFDALKLGLQDARWVDTEQRSTPSLSSSSSSAQTSTSKLAKSTKRSPSMDAVLTLLQHHHHQQQQGQRPCRKSVVRRLLRGHQRNGEGTMMSKTSSAA